MSIDLHDDYCINGSLDSEHVDSISQKEGMIDYKLVASNNY